MFITEAKAFELTEKYGSPLYVYDEKILRTRCREIKELLPGRNLRVNYSAKANSSLELLKIVHEEGIDADAMSPGEIYVEMAAGFKPENIFYIGNNVSVEEMRYAAERGITVSADSLSQLEIFGKNFPHCKAAVRFNPGVGAGHSDKVVTGGKKTKFGVQLDFIPQVKEIVKKYDIDLVGIDQHIGSLFMNGEPYVEGVKSLLKIAEQFPGLKFIDMGGGFGVPYHDGEERLDLKKLSVMLDEVIAEFLEGYDNKDVIFKVEPGRYISAECGLLLGEVNSVKENYSHTYVGTDIGFNVLMRPVLYDSYHEVRILKRNGDDGSREVCTVVGNICESGDILAKDRTLPAACEGDLVAVETAGAYGYAMSSCYNCRLRPAEVLIAADGTDRLIRRRDTFEDLIRNFV